MDALPTSCREDTLPRMKRDGLSPRIGAALVVALAGIIASGTIVARDGVSDTSVAGAPQASTGVADPAGDSAWILVRTLVVDALGTRTVDTWTARVRFGQSGLLMSQIPYGGPPVSFQLVVRADAPTSDGIPLHLRSEVWRGSSDARPAEADITRREETALIAPGTSYLMELSHERHGPDGGPGSERRIVLSVTVSLEGAPPVEAAAPTRAVHFLLQIIRRSGTEVDLPDTHALSSLVGRPVTYSSSVRSARPAPPAESADDDGTGGTGPREPADGNAGSVGVSVTVIAERVADELVTVRLRVSGADIDPVSGLAAPIHHESVHTVRDGTPILVEATPEAGTPPGSGGAPAALVYAISVTPSLGR